MTTASELADELEAAKARIERSRGSLGVSSTWVNAFAHIAHDNLPTILSALCRVEKLEAALRVAEHDLTATDNLRTTDLTLVQFNDCLLRGVPRDELEWVIDHSHSLETIRQALTGEA